MDYFKWVSQSIRTKDFFLMNFSSSNIWIDNTYKKGLYNTFFGWTAIGLLKSSNSIQNSLDFISKCPTIQKKPFENIENIMVKILNSKHFLKSYLYYNSIWD